ncbi:efflux RND transporter permease subunit [Gynuella sp.]|uniref:efflux RND transporter permease subunit n=1 Tax=Gynuella sp. TaxID=2969146 RepID=UPI003D0FC56C
MNTKSTGSTSFFEVIIRFRWLVILLCIGMIAAAISFIPRLTKDTSAGAFIAPDNPALLFRDQVKEQFGLADPIVIGVINQGQHGVFNPKTLALVSWLTEQVKSIDNVDPEKVMSLATESNVVGTDTGMEVDEFLATLPTTQAEAESVRSAVKDFPLYNGSLVARDGLGTLIVVELVDEKKALATYEAIQDVITQAPKGPDDQLLVAGEGAVAGYLSTYIDQDAKRLNPLAGITITIILFVAFRTLRATLLPNLIILATAAITLGIMAASQTPFYVITNGLIVCMIGIAVADSIHVFSQYYEEREKTPDASQRELTIRTMKIMTRPVTLTTFTTAAGFLALYPTTDMPPIQSFGLFGALAVLAAWFFTMTLFPAVLSLLKPRKSRSFTQNAGTTGSASHQWMTRFGHHVLGHPKTVLGIGLLIIIVGGIGLSRVKVEDQRIENFKPTEPLYQADKQINQVMDGTYNLDVVVEAADHEGLHNPHFLAKIEKLQDYLTSLPHINGANSVVDYIKQMNKAVNENRPETYIIPDDDTLIAQLFLLYSISGDPTDFEEEINSDHTKALVRAYLDTDTFENNRKLIPLVEEYLGTEFNEPGLTGTVTGLINVDYHWINGVASSHTGSVIVSVLAVLVMACLLFRSFVIGLFAVIPVAVSILLVYATMGFAGIWLGVGTSMFAAIAIGLGVDFAIHTMERIRDLTTRNGNQNLGEVLLDLYPTTGRALFFNLAAVALGFSVLCSSDVPPLVRFGLLVAMAVSAAFLASVTLLPALVMVLKPRALSAQANHSVGPKAREAIVTSIIVGVIAMAYLTQQHAFAAEALPSGMDIMKSVSQREEGDQITRNLELELIDRQGKTRTQQVRAFRRYFGDEKRTVLFYTAPANLRGTGFLTYDYPSSQKDDDQWLYLPALRKIRRIPASNRGDYFLGTDFTYEEIKSENKVELTDYSFTTTGKETIDGVDCYVIEGTPVNDKIAKELGYSKAVWRIDPDILISRKSDYWDTNSNHLKTIENKEIQQISGIWTVMKVIAVNHKTGHSTVMISSDVDYDSPIAELAFEQRSLTRGL